MNICILIVDCLRADHLGCYGYKKNTSPNMDRIAATNTKFENAYSQSNWTAPSFYSMIAGKYPTSVAITWLDQKINPYFKVLPEYLAEKGFLTGLFTPFKILLNQNAFSSHFNDVREVSLDSRPLDEFKKFLKKNKNSFLLFHTAEYVHEPYYADPGIVKKFVDSNLQPPDGSELVDVLTSRKVAKTSISHINRKVNGHMKFPSKHEIEYLIGCYDAGIYHVDGFVGDVYDMLKQESDDYIFMLIADHGQAFMEHGYIGHGIGMHNEVIHVPLIVDYNGSTGKQTIPETVQLMDIFPTLTELLGFDTDLKLDGKSFAPALEGKALENDRIAFSDGSPGLCYIKDDFKLISNYLKYMDYKKYLKIVKSKHGIRFRDRMGRITKFRRDKLYHLQQDPGETKNIHYHQKQLSHDLRKELKQLIDMAFLEMHNPEDTFLDDDIKKQLKALGYL